MPENRIDLPNGEVLILDADFREQVLGGVTRRTGQNLDKKGLPYAMVAGRKWRPLKAGREWLAARIVSKQPQRQPRKARATT
jgi:hypothetical protein